MLPLSTCVPVFTPLFSKKNQRGPKKLSCVVRANLASYLDCIHSATVCKSYRSLLEFVLGWPARLLKNKIHSANYNKKRHSISNSTSNYRHTVQYKG